MSELNLVIVTGGGYDAEYARKLYALLSERKIESVLWTEKEFLANRPTLSNMAHIVFFGLGNETKAQSKAIGKGKWSYDLYGCKIGMHGNICVVTAREKDLPGKELQEFAFYCEQRSEKHPDIIIPAVMKNDGVKQVILSKLTKNDDKSVRKSQYSMLVYEFIENWLDIFINGEHVGDS